MKVQVLGMGYSLPENVMTNQDLERLMETSNEWIIERTGIKERRIVDPGTPVSELAVTASQMALADAGINPEQLDLIIVATVTPDMMFPSTACILQAALGAINAAAFDLEAGCTGFIYALTVAEKFLAADDCRHILIVGAETLSKIVDYTDRGTGILFGDGAGAMVLGKGQKYGILNTCIGADGRGGDLLYMPAGGSRLPASAETVSQGLHFARMNGSEVFKFAIKTMVEVSEKMLKRAGLTYDDIDLLVPHQANLRIIQTAAKRMRISGDRIVINIDRFGNMSSASIPVALALAAEEGRVKAGDMILLVGFGAGLTFGGAIIQWGRD